MIWCQNPGRERGFSLLQNVHTCPGAYQVFYSMGMGDYFPSSKQPGDEAVHSPQSSDKVQNMPVIFYSVQEQLCIFKKSVFLYTFVNIHYTWVDHLIRGMNSKKI
jgi:hypothetical protein